MKKHHHYLRYAGLGFEILATILIFTGIGYGLDKWAGTEKPWFTLGFSLFGIVVALYYAVRTALRDK
jgi:F0F1-type ATP synthase assembly protein I